MTVETGWRRRYYDPCDGSRAVKWRWRMAGWLNRLPRTCWAHIVSWALGSRPLFDRYGEDDIRRTPMCFQPGDERCYCGKFANPLPADAPAAHGGPGEGGTKAMREAEDRRP